MSRPGARLATAADVAVVCTTLALAFADDPVWGWWAFPDPADRVERLSRYWEPFVRAGLKYDGVWVTADAGAVAVWVPPGVAEMDSEDEAAAAATVEELCGDRARLLLDCFDRFDAAHPRAEPHWYLSLLATHPDRRGAGLAMGLVTDRLDLADADHLGAYLESTNDGNLPRYEKAGFRRFGTVDVPQGPTVTTLWRPAR